MRQLAAVLIVILWAYSLVVMADFPKIGIYLIMLKSVATVLLQFSALFASIIIGFALSFHLLGTIILIKITKK